MNIAGSIRQLIADNTTAFGLVGDRVFPIVALQAAAFPHVIVRKTKTQRQPAHGEKSHTRTIMLEVISVDPSAKTAIEVDEAVEAALDNFTGQVTFKGETCLISGINILDTKEGFDATDNVCLVLSEYSIRVTILGT